MGLIYGALNHVIHNLQEGISPITMMCTQEMRLSHKQAIYHTLLAEIKFLLPCLAGNQVAINCTHCLGKHCLIGLFVSCTDTWLWQEHSNGRMSFSDIQSVFCYWIQQSKMFCLCLVQLLVDFYCDRAKDRHIVIPHVLGGLWALVSYHSLPSGGVRQICTAVFKEIHIQVRTW